MGIPVFVSSRFDEFSTLRAELTSRLRATGVFDPLALDDGSAAPVSITDRSVVTVARADVVVLLLGATYADDPGTRRSPTHLEFLRARELRRTLFAYRLPALSGDATDPRALDLLQEVLTTSESTVGELGGEPVKDAARIVADLESLLLWQPMELREENLAELARYVGANHTARMWLNESRALDIRRSAEGVAKGNRAVTRRLLELVGERRFALLDKPLSLDQAQRVRHPSELDTAAGTSLDLTVLFASVCLGHDLAPILAVGRVGRDTEVWAIIDLERDLRQADEVWSDQPHRRLHGADPWLGQLRTDRYFSVDISPLARRSDVTEQLNDPVRSAEDSGRDLLAAGRFDEVFLTDVLAQHEAGAPTFRERPIDQLPPITRMLPPAPRFADLSDGRARTLERLCATRGTAVLVGPSGVGKSMLALKAAADADHGFGWFLSAGSRSELTAALAEAEALHSGERLDFREMSPNDLGALAQMALARLAASNAPWVVVIDNADVDPKEILSALPAPDPTCGQLVLITTTDRDLADRGPLGWGDHFEQVEIIDPLDEELAHYPKSLHIAGRPLFSSAYDALASALGVAIGDLGRQAESLPATFDGEDVLWALAGHHLSPSERVMALLMALGPPDDLDVEALTKAHARTWFTDGDGDDGHDIGRGETHIARLCSLGLSQPWWPGTARMHRRIARAIHGDALRRAPEELLRAIEATLAVGAGTDESLERLGASLRGPAWPDTPEVAGARSRLLHEIGRQVDPIRGVRGGVESMRDAHEIWPHGDDEQQADRLHAEARLIFQHEKSRAADGLPLIEASLGHRDRALDRAAEESARRAMLKERWRSVALRGMLLVEVASSILRRDHLTSDEIEAAERQTAIGSALVDDALEARRQLVADRLGPGEVDPDLLRGEYNQAFTAVNIAQQPQRAPADRLAWLDRAQRHYANVLEGRLRLRQPPTAHLAASYAGFALTAYLRGTTQGVPPGVSSGHLREATGHLRKALDLRESFEPVDGQEIAKTVFLLSKISLARFDRSMVNRQMTEEEVAREFDRLLAQLREEVHLPW